MLKDLLASLFHPSEVVSMVTVKVGKGVPGAKSNKAYTGDLQQLAHTLNDLDFCYAVLNKVSRSFAVVIQQLPYELKTAVCIFYLVLRGLDSVEDDMTYDVHSKIPLLRSFHSKLYESEWRIQDVGDTDDYRILLANFQKVIHEFLKLKPEYQEVIADVTKQMGEGMAEYAQKLDVKPAVSSSSNGAPANTTYNVNTKAEYDKYCYYVAGLVGYGLCQLFGASGLEDKNLAKQQRLWNSMGMFLQKTNIIRDYLEDLHAARMWWPKEIWSQYAPTLQWFQDHPDSDQALQCLNHMIHDALSLVPDVLEYLSHLRHQQIFEFCAIPQVMAIATLATIHNNVNVFKRMVKIRKGLTCRILLECKNRQQVGAWFNEFTEQMLQKVNPSTDVQSANTIKMLKAILQQTQNAAANDPELITLQHTSSNPLNGKSLYSPKTSSPTATPAGFRSSSIAWILLVTCLFILYSKRASGDFAGTTLDSLLPSFTLKRDNSLEMAALLGGSFSFLYLVNSVLNRP